MKEKRECKSCEFGGKMTVHSKELYCHRFPPTRIDRGACDYPVVMSSSWCGEYKPKGV